MNDTDTAFLCQGNGQPRFGNRVHGRGQYRDLQADIAGQPALQAGIARQDAGVSRKQQDIIKGKGFLHNAHRDRVPPVESGRQL